MHQDNFAYYEEWSDAEERIERAHELYDSGRWQDALRELQAAIDINPTNSNWFFNKGLTLDTLDRYHDAIDAFEKAVELNDKDIEVLNCLAVDYTRVGQYTLAMKTFERLEELAPDYEPVYCNRIIMYSEMGRHDEAEQMFYLARQLKEHCPLCYYNMGNSLFSQQMYDRAIWCWKQTQTIEPNHPQIDCRIAQAYWAKGDYEMAKDHFLAELRRSPGDTEVLIDMGILLLEMNDLESAREKFNRVLEMDPDRPQAHHYLGELNFHAGRTAQAMECFNRALDVNPRQHGSHFRLGQCYHKLGQIANAREHLLEEMKVALEHPDVLLEMGCLLEDVGASGEAMQCFERVIDLRPDEAQAYHDLSLCYYRNGLIEQGMDLSLRVLELDPHHVMTLHNLSYVYKEKGQYEKALQYVLMALDCEMQNESLIKLKREIMVRRGWQRTVGPIGGVIKTVGSKIRRKDRNAKTLK